MQVERTKVSFQRERDFISELRQRVDDYFKERHLSPKAGMSMYLKSLFLLGLVALCYGAVLSGIGGVAGLFTSYIFTGFFVAVGTMNISHDALHGAYASRPWINRSLGLLMDLFGASSFYWRRGHVVEHHTFTNIAEYDADLRVPAILRLCPKVPHRPFHRFQHIYAPFLYCLNVVHWIYVSDLKRIYAICRNWRSAADKRPPNREVALMALFKAVHILLFVGVPLMVVALPWWVIVLGYLASLAVEGITLTIVFQLAHIVEDVAFPLPDEHGKMENSFIKHQFATTSNFAMGNWLICFLIGGLNFQVEHHLLPYVCHIHLPKIAPIVQSVAKEFGLPYHAKPSLLAAIRSHFRTLKKLGCKPKRPS